LPGPADTAAQAAPRFPQRQLYRWAPLCARKPQPASAAARSRRLVALRRQGYRCRK